MRPNPDGTLLLPHPPQLGPGEEVPRMGIAASLTNPALQGVGVGHTPTPLPSCREPVVTPGWRTSDGGARCARIGDARNRYRWPPSPC
jgi:hypothetical protein